MDKTLSIIKEHNANKDLFHVKSVNDKQTKTKQESTGAKYRTGKIYHRY